MPPRWTRGYRTRQTLGDVGAVNPNTHYTWVGGIGGGGGGGVQGGENGGGGSRRGLGGGGGTLGVGWVSRWGDLGCWGAGGGAQAPLTSSCAASNNTITINLTLTFAASWFGHASHVYWAQQDLPNAFAISLLSILDPNTNSDPCLG